MVKVNRCGWAEFMPEVLVVVQGMACGPNQPVFGGHVRFSLRGGRVKVVGGAVGHHPRIPGISVENKRSGACAGRHQRRYLSCRVHVAPAAGLNPWPWRTVPKLPSDRFSGEDGCRQPLGIRGSSVFGVAGVPKDVSNPPGWGALDGVCVTRDGVCDGYTAPGNVGAARLGLGGGINRRMKGKVCARNVIGACGNGGAGDIRSNRHGPGVDGSRRTRPAIGRA